ncbi:MAG: helicase-exonuclease AddAB subunit AddA [Lachnospiraceae bacterium]|nr:helicase-exonuclease AddAB subunit AddA [Lachnospiraceae bacterium]
MGKPKWTPEQKQVIDLRERNILVSAAAGSGKTAVLVERIIAEISEGDSPKDIDKLLVVTFTKAAAAEMRARIGKALEVKLLEQPENKHIQRQASLLHTAQITTIDSFCQSIIKNYFHVINLDPSFRVGDETDLELLKQDILKEVIEEKYQQARENGDDRFLQFTDMLSTGRTDHAIEEMVLSLFQVANSYPWPDEWLLGCSKMYQYSDMEEFEGSEWIKGLLDYLKACTAEFIQMAQKAYDICQDTNGPKAYEDAIQSDIAFLKILQGADSYQEYQDCFLQYNPARLKAIRSKEVDNNKKDTVKNLRENYQKNGLSKLKERFFFQDMEGMLSDMQKMAPAVQQLIELTMDFERAFAERKREEGIVDFADMERFALEILLDKDEEGVHPSETARELQEYYEEILTDEYQDSNYIQELLLTSLCRAPENRPYLFMVGDVKQSIYKFRLARPELFLEKYQNYTIGHGPFQRIDLHQNFRSRGSVLDSANYIFEQIMKKSLGGIVYDKDARLAAGVEFKECDNRIAGKTEVILIEQKSDDAFVQKKSLEAAVIGEKIREMVQGGQPLYVNGEDGYRPVKYGDIAILLRSLTGWSEEFIETLSDMGIPAYADTKTGYFTSLEVETILNLLHLVDNPRQDIPLAAVLRSILGNVSDEELAWIGTLPRGVDFWDKIECFLGYMEWNNGDKDKQDELRDTFVKKGIDFLEIEKSWVMEEEAALILRDKLSVFVDRLRSYQKFAKTRSVYELLRKIYEETGYYHFMAAMPSGEKRLANLDILLQQSIEFAENGHQGIYGFTRYIESLHKSNVDFGEASVNGENTNAVRIMTIHKSKGLEFPVVFTAGMGKQFNLMDARKSTIIDGDYGVGCDFVDLDLRVKQPTLLKKFMANQISLNTLAEEIRILYVALTRAKEQLFITGTASGLGKKLAGWFQKSEFLDFFQLSSAQTYLDWIVPALLKREKIGNAFREYLSDGEERKAFSTGEWDNLFDVKLSFPENVIQDEKEALKSAAEQYRILENWDTDTVYDEEMRGAIEQQTSYHYPYGSDGALPVKISVSELKRREGEQTRKLEEEQEIFLDGLGEELIPDSAEPEIPKPSFLQDRQELSGAARGTLYHLVMEHFPYRQIGKEEWTEVEFETYLRQMVQDGYMSEEESRLLDVRKFTGFLRSRIGQRMFAAELDGRLRREQPFMLGFKANQIYPEQQSEEMIIVQGMIDAFFFENDYIVLIDYKTDFVSFGREKELVKKYRTQLTYYAEALERLTGKKVKEKVIYSFALGKEVVV